MSEALECAWFQEEKKKVTPQGFNQLYSILLQHQGEIITRIDICVCGRETPSESKSCPTGLIVQIKCFLMTHTRPTHLYFRVKQIELDNLFVPGWDAVRTLAFSV